MVGWVLFPGAGYHELYNGVVCNDTILATGVFSSKELWMLSKGTTYDPLFIIYRMDSLFADLWDIESLQSV